jgi:hypothetical protein
LGKDASQPRRSTRCAARWQYSGRGRKLGIPDFSGEGEYLTHHTIEEIVDTLGKPEDDVNNTFTARLLLPLESRPLLATKFIMTLS